MTLDYTRNPPVYSCNQHVKDKYLDYLTTDTLRVDEQYNENIYYYEIPRLRENLLWLMHVLDTPYDARTYDDRPIRKREDFSADELAFYRPFAFLLSCLDGNAFVDHTRPETFGHIDHYVSDAERVMSNNRTGLDTEEKLKELRRYMELALQTDLGKS